MDTPPIPKPRTVLSPTEEPKNRPVPLPRTKLPAVNNNERVTASDIFRSISTVSKQITEEVATKVQTSAKSANEMIEKSFLDGSRLARGTLEKTLTTSRAVRDSVTKSVIEGTKTAGLRMHRSKKISTDIAKDSPQISQRCLSMPDEDISLFHNIQFHSPLLEQKKYQNKENLHDIGNPTLQFKMALDDLSLISNSDSNVETVSTISHDSREPDDLSQQLETYDTIFSSGSRPNSVCGMNNEAVPDVCERKKNHVRSLPSLGQHNSMSYENWNLCDERVHSIQENVSPRPSKSTIFEFDPLNTSATKYEGVSNELLLLQSFLGEDTYGAVGSRDNDDSLDLYFETDYFNPPTPPERSDSLIPSVNNVSSQDIRKSNWYVDDKDKNETSVSDEKANSNSNTSVRKKFSNMLKLDILNKSNKHNTAKLETVQKPAVGTSPAQFYSGVLTRIVSGMEDLFKSSQQRYCVLSDHKLSCYADPKHTVLKEEFSFDNIYSIQIVLPLSSSITGNSFCLEILVSSGVQKSTPKKITFSCTNASERRTWGQKIVENLAPAFPSKYPTEFTRCGWCYLKEEVSGEWQGAWLMLIRRILVYYTSKDSRVKTVDLRKTRCIGTQAADENTKMTCPSDGSGDLLLHCPDVTLYLHFPHERELKGWRIMVKIAAHNNGIHIHHQQLTKEEVPTIVDKCINFLYAHGSLTEGIYRRAGSNSVLSELLARFRKDAWSVQLSPAEHTEHDVAGVLKRFFRDLPEPLIPKSLHQQMLAALEIKDDETRRTQYGKLMAEMPLVVQNTVRKLFAHLHFLQSMSSVNKMSAENLASVWTPTIMPGALYTAAPMPTWSSREVVVIRELISAYESVWPPTRAERRREAAVRAVLLRVVGRTAHAPAAGDLRAWVHVRDRSHCHQVTLTPNKTSGEICNELCEKAGVDSHLLMLEEVICGDSMKRIIHIDEVVLDVVLRWGYWDEEDRKDNYLLLRENKILYDMDALRATTSLVCGELKIANESSKTFKLHMFEFKNLKLCYFKDKQGSQQINEWHIKDIFWYIGHEPKRDPHTRWSITFIPRQNKPNRNKDHPWFGCTIAGAVTEDQLRWMTAMMFAEHANILPTPRLVIT